MSQKEHQMADELVQRCPHCTNIAQWRKNEKNSFQTKKQFTSHNEVIAASAVPDVGLVATMTSLPSAWKLPLEARQPGQTSGTI
jgi:hypothetical protein